MNNDRDKTDSKCRSILINIPNHSYIRIKEPAQLVAKWKTEGSNLQT